MDGKTPVTLLHEYLMKNREIPDYKLVYNGVGTHDPLFRYEVSAKGKVAVGEGKSKKEAKHDAARALLEQLEEEVKVVSPYEDSLKENAVGTLQGFLTRHNIASPVYELIRDEGLAHAKIFGIRCRVSSFTTEAEDRTKKQAKQQASHLMLLKLQKCFSNGYFIDIPDLDCRLRTSMSDFSSQFLENVLPLSEALRSIADKDDSFFENHQDPEELLTTILAQLDYHYNYDFLQTNTETDFLCALHVRELNCANFIGLSTSEIAARKKAAIKALQFLSTMSKA